MIGRISRGHRVQENCTADLLEKGGSDAREPSGGGRWWWRHLRRQQQRVAPPPLYALNRHGPSECPLWQAPQDMGTAVIVGLIAVVDALV